MFDAGEVVAGRETQANDVVGGGRGEKPKRWIWGFDHTCRGPPGNIVLRTSPEWALCSLSDL